ncbi:MAG: ABC transporter permease subunit [Phycisphaeraceae bacterium]|nr:ABC transporter permease subunit [Phycisphaeraceae bacterium]
MPHTCTIAKRELTSLFYSPIAYVVMGLFAVGTTMIFMMSFGPSQPASLRQTLGGVIWLLIFLAPAISMRLLAEEIRSGTIETLMTAPISDTQVILGKWFGAMAFYALLLLPLVILAAVLEIKGDPDYGPIFTGLVGLLLVGGFYLAIGTFASAVTQNQIIAFLITLFIICFFTLVMFFLPQAGFIGNRLRSVLYYLNVNSQFEDFNKGLLSLTNAVYFLSGIALFLFLAVKLLESKRWR